MFKSLIICIEMRLRLKESHYIIDHIMWHQINYLLSFELIEIDTVTFSSVTLFYGTIFWIKILVEDHIVAFIWRNFFREVSIQALELDWLDKLKKLCLFFNQLLVIVFLYEVNNFIINLKAHIWKLQSIHSHRILWWINITSKQICHSAFTINTSICRFESLRFRTKSFPEITFFCLLNCFFDGVSFFYLNY